MASKREELEVQIVATDKASKVISKVADAAEDLGKVDASVELTAEDLASGDIKDVSDKTDKLDKQSADVELTAQDKASADIRTLTARIKDLTDDEKKVILSAEKKKLESEVQASLKLLAKVDGETFEAVLDAKDSAKAKIDAVDDALDAIDKRTVDAAVEADDLASGDLGRIDGKLDDLDKRTVDATVDAHAGSGFSGIMSRVEGMPTTMGGVSSAVGGMVGRAGPVAILATTLAGAAVSAANTATEIGNLATFAGTSTEEASRLYAVMQDNNVESTDLLDIIGQMSGVLATNPELVTDMGISMDTVRQGPVAVLQAVMSKFWADGTLSDQERIVAMQLFGEEGVRQINNIATAVNGDLKGAMDDVSESRIFNDDDVKSARDFNRSINDASGAFKSIAADVGKPVLEIITPALQGLAMLADKIPAAFDLLTLDSGSLREADFSQPLLDYFALLQQGRKEAEAWDLAFGSMEGFDAQTQRVEDATAMIQRGIPVSEAMGEVFGSNEEDSLALAQALGIIDSATGDVTDTTDENTAAMEAAADVRKRVSDAIDTQVESLDEEIDKLGDEVGALEESRDAQLDLIDAKRSATDAAYAARDAQDDFTQSLADYDEVAGNAESTEQDRADALDDTRKAAIDAADGQQRLREETAKANGVTLTAAQGVDTWNDSILRSAAQARGPARQAILDYAYSYNEIPEAVQSEIQAAIDRGDLNEAIRLLNGASAPRKAAVRADASQASINTANAKIDTTTRRRTAVVEAQARTAQANSDIDWAARKRYSTITTIAKSGGRGYTAATGTPHANRGTYLVGEQGPELVEMSGGERVNTAGETAQMGSSGGDHYVQNVVNNWPAGVSARDVSDAQRRYARRNAV